MSWGWFEGGQCENAPDEGPCSGGGGEPASFAYVEATNAGFLAATARGVTIVVASGDAGAHGRSDPSCESAAPLPDWPASSPYVLTVGGTQLIHGVALENPKSPLCAQTGSCAGNGTEIVCSHHSGSLITSGGGFSLVASQPPWQANAVRTYLASGALLPKPGEFNATNRGYPDVAAFAHNIAAFQDGLVQVGVPVGHGSSTGAALECHLRPPPSSAPHLQLDGTSAAAPIVAAYIAAANAQRVALGKPTLGFVNPAIYSIAARQTGAFTDIVEGDNTCTGVCKAGCSGYGAAKGWDAVTGWGSPVVSVLLPALASL